MFPWQNIEISKGIKERLIDMTEWAEGYTEILLEENLIEIKKFLRENKLELNLFTNHRGKVLGACPGQLTEKLLQEWEDIEPASNKNLSGIRWLYFGEMVQVDQLNLLESYIFARYGFDLLVKGDILTEEAALFYPEVEKGVLTRGYIKDTGYTINSLCRLEPTGKIIEINAKLKEEITYTVKPLTEKAILVGLDLPTRNNRYPLKESLTELKQLAMTAGAQVVGEIWQSRDNPHPAFYIGQGKVEEMRYQVYLEGIDLIIFDDELSPA